LLVLVGLYVRLKITETPAFQKVLDRNERVKLPAVTVFREHGRMLVLGTLISLATFVLFYLMTVFALSWGTTVLGYARREFLMIQLFPVVFLARRIAEPIRHRMHTQSARSIRHVDRSLPDIYPVAGRRLQRDRRNIGVGQRRRRGASRHRAHHLRRR
jgi:hypothetical protein